MKNSPLLVGQGSKLIVFRLRDKTPTTCLTVPAAVTLAGPNLGLYTHDGDGIGFIIWDEVKGQD